MAGDRVPMGSHPGPLDPTPAFEVAGCLVRPPIWRQAVNLCDPY